MRKPERYTYHDSSGLAINIIILFVAALILGVAFLLPLR